MEKKNTTVLYNGLVWGLIIGFAGIVYAVILYMLNQNLNQTLGYAGMLITIVLLIIGTRSFRDTVRNGVLPFGPAFSFGFVAIAVSGLLGIIYAYLQWTVFDPDILDKMMDMQLEKMIERGLSDAQAEEALKVSAGLMKPWLMAVLGFFSSLFFGTIIALIVAAIFKRDEDQVPIVAEETEE